MMGTDSGAGEGAGDHTIFGLVYDHGAGFGTYPTLYWRSYHSQVGGEFYSSYSSND